jgi:hypothetical protein
MNTNTTLIRGIRREEKRAKRTKGAERDFSLAIEREAKKRAEKERRDQRRKEKEWLLLSETCF